MPLWRLSCRGFKVDWNRTRVCTWRVQGHRCVRMWRRSTSELEVLLWLRTLQHVVCELPLLLSQTTRVRITRSGRRRWHSWRWGSVESKVVRVTTLIALWFCVIFTLFTLVAVVLLALLFLILFRIIAIIPMNEATGIQWFSWLALFARWWGWCLWV